jgi:hypothetical protein
VTRFWYTLKNLHPGNFMPFADGKTHEHFKLFYEQFRLKVVVIVGVNFL